MYRQNFPNDHYLAGSREDRAKNGIFKEGKWFLFGLDEFYDVCFLFYFIDKTSGEEVRLGCWNNRIVTNESEKVNKYCPILLFRGCIFIMEKLIVQSILKENALYL